MLIEHITADYESYTEEGDSDMDKGEGISKMKIILFGAGRRLLRFLEESRIRDYVEIIAVVDNNPKKWGTVIEGYEVAKPDLGIFNREYDKIVVTSIHFDEIKEQLAEQFAIPGSKVTEERRLIVPERYNMGSIVLKGCRDKCYDVDDLESDQVLAANGLEAFFFSKGHRLINKWWHYFEIYHTFFAKYIGKEVRMLEIGVYKGGSLQMWKHYFGAQATIVGIDINPECRQFEEENIHICIGSQADSPFLENVCGQYGPFDIILDDGSHVMNHQITSFKVLFPLLKENGVYLCEDTHTSYWPSYQGGFGKKDTFMEFAKRFADEINHQHIQQDENGLIEKELLAEFREKVHGVHFYDSIVVFEKRKSGQSFWSMR